jgi:serine/threonine protein kinase
MLKKVNFTEFEALEYFTMILIALDFLHKEKIIHRDLKPANILIDKLNDGSKILKLSDFGLSKKIDLKEFMTNNLSSDGNKKTTPAYTSPEAFNNEDINGKADIWALGIILYQLVSGMIHPFERKNKD